MSDDKAHITWFSFEGEFVCDYPTFLYDRPSQATIEAMVPSRVLRVTGQQLEQFFNHCTTPRERYEMLLQRCPGIMELLDLQDIASFLNVHPNTVSKIRRDITFSDR